MKILASLLAFALVALAMMVPIAAGALAGTYSGNFWVASMASVMSYFLILTYVNSFIDAEE